MAWIAVATLAAAQLACGSRQGVREVHGPSIYADAADPIQRADLHLRDERPDLARRALDRLDRGALDDDGRARLLLLRAEIALAEARAQEALRILPPPEQWTNPALRQDAERLRALAHFRLGNAVVGTRLLVERERLLSDTEKQRGNRMLLWHELQSADLDAVLTGQLGDAGLDTLGWLELAMISRSVWVDSGARRLRIDEWRQGYPGHPAESFVDELPAFGLGDQPRIQKIGLLLPLSGPFAPTAQALRDGMLDAHYARPDARPIVRVYDTGEHPESLLAAQQQALNDGAEFLIGPLRKADVATLAAAGPPPVPVLALNFLEPGTEAPFNFFQWGLSPQDEARQAAEHAVIEHRFRAVALVPEGDWGARVLSAFEQRLSELGGEVVDARSYEPDGRDHSEPIRALMALGDSEERHRAVRIALGTKVVFEPRRRGDVDLIFIAARPDPARLIWTQFRFHRAADLPIYATALVYDGNRPNADLNGLRFCDMPWMIEQEGAWAARRERMLRLFPGRNRQDLRLYALGHDAYTLVSLIESGQLQPGSYFPSATGTLALQYDGVVQRGLDCVEISRGELKPVAIPMLDTPDDEG